MEHFESAPDAVEVVQRDGPARLRVTEDDPDAAPAAELVDLVQHFAGLVRTSSNDHAIQGHAQPVRVVVETSDRQDSRPRWNRRARAAPESLP